MAFTIRRYSDSHALRRAADTMLARSVSKINIITREADKLRVLFTPEELKRVSFITPEEYDG